jgi:Tfp pilus assembly protein PilV
MSILNALDPYRWLAGGVVVLSIVGGALAYRASLIEDGHEQTRQAVQIEVAKQAEISRAQTANMQEVANEAQAKYTESVAAAKAAADRAAADLARLRSKAASSGQLANASRETLSEYAADAERDIDWCAGRLSRVGEEAAGASAAAHALNDAWPEYKEFQGRLADFTTKLKGNTP